MLEFNPWQWADRNELFHGFFKEIAAALGGGLDDDGKRARDWERYAGYLQAALRLTSGSPTPTVAAVLAPTFALFAIAPFLSGTSKILVTALAVVFGALTILVLASERVATFVGDLLRLRQTGSEPGIQAAKNKVRDQLMTLEKPLLVIMDDVDRLPPDEIRLLFQLVKINADFPNLVYLLCFNRGVG